MRDTVCHLFNSAFSLTFTRELLATKFHCLTMSRLLHDELA
jgi:hypothetical protein